jgi:FlaG/FlaF family flagellin (archaellin)
MVAVVVILAATISVFVLGFTEETTEAGPIVGQSAGILEPNPPGSGSDNGFVRVRHMAGDTVQTADMEIVVDATDACGKQARLVNLPVDGYSGNAIGSTNIEGDDVFDERPPYFGGPEYSAIHETEYMAGEEILFRIPNNDCSVRSGDEVIVRVVHTPTNSVVIKETLTAT